MERKRKRKDSDLSAKGFAKGSNELNEIRLRAEKRGGEQPWIMNLESRESVGEGGRDRWWSTTCFAYWQIDRRRGGRVVFATNHPLVVCVWLKSDRNDNSNRFIANRFTFSLWMQPS
jgi:hypothetical protein